MCCETKRRKSLNTVAIGSRSPEEVKRYMRKSGLIGTLLVGALLWLATDARAQVIVSNLTVNQRAGTKLVDISYDISSSISGGVFVSLAISNGTEAIPAVSITGDVGNISKGTGKNIVWDMGTDWGGNYALLSFTIKGSPEGGDPTASSWISVNSRWIRNFYSDGSITMSDLSTNLIWVYNTSANGRATRNNAITLCSNLAYAGHSDWFLPSYGAMAALHFQEGFFTQVQDADYWCYGTNATTGMAANPIQYYGHSMLITNRFWVWPCRER